MVFEGVPSSAKATWYWDLGSSTTVCLAHHSCGSDYYYCTYSDMCKNSELGTTASRPFGGVESDRAQHLGFRCRRCRYLSNHSPSGKTPCFRLHADSSLVVMPNPSSELHSSPTLHSSALHFTLLLLQNSICFHER
jgi:hypothetical protein